MNLEQLVSAIKNKVRAAIPGSPVLEFRDDLIEKDIDITRASLISEMAANGTLPYDDLVQRIDNLEIKPTSLVKINNNPVVLNNDNVKEAQIPRLSAISESLAIAYIGNTLFEKSFPVYKDINFRSHKRRKVTGCNPFVYIDLAQDNDYHIVYVFNYSGKYISVRAIFDSPMNVPGAWFNTNYPATDSMKQEIVNKLVTDYVNQYKQANQKFQIFYTK